MVITSKLRAAKKFGPGYFIREQMEIREWTQADLAEIMGITVKHLNKILQNNQPITLDIARVLAGVFNTSAEYWINLDTAYRLWLVNTKTDKESDAEIKSLIYSRMPISDMLKKGWLQPYSNISTLQSQVLDFWNMKSLNFSEIDSHLMPFLTKKSKAYNQFNASYALTWYRMAQNIAGTINVSAYSRQKLAKLFDNIHTFSVKPDGINTFIKELNSVGVIFFVLPHLLKTYLDGAAFYSGKSPVIVFTARYKRIDNFWFTIAHEIAHILHHLNEDIPFILDNLKDGVIDQMEEEANSLAGDKLKHKEILEYLKPHLGYLTVSKVEECAEEYEVHPSVIIGKLAFEKEISYSNQSLFNENVLEIIDKKYKIAGL